MILAAGRSDDRLPYRSLCAGIGLSLRQLRLRKTRALRLILGLATLLYFSFSTGSEPPAATAVGGTNVAGSYTFGTENSWIRIQNIGDADANIQLTYYDEQGRAVTGDGCPSPSCPTMYPGSGWTFFQQYHPGLPLGFQGSAVVTTDQPIVALMAKDVWRDGRFSIAGDTMTPGPGSHRMYLPVTSKRDGANAEWNGRFVIQNLSETVTACVTITYLGNFADDEVAWEPYKPPSGGRPSNPVAGCPNGGMPLAPRGSIFRHPDSMPVPSAFTGSVRVDLHKNGQGLGPERQFISATADTWNANTSSFSSYRGFDEGELNKEIVLPLIDREVGPRNSYSTRFQIMNRSPSRPAQVTLSIEGYDLSSGEPVYVAKSNTLTIRASRMCYQDRDDENNCLAAGDRLPFNFVGTVRLTSTEPIAAVVLRGTWFNDTFTDYRAIRPQDGARRILLPVLNKHYGAVPRVGNGWGSWFRVMVADGGWANVKVTYYGIDLPGGSVSYTLLVNREFTSFQYAEWLLPAGFAGTAIIESDRPVVALANLFNDLLPGDPDLLYNGISLD